jgi:MraZ protein
VEQSLKDTRENRKISFRGFYGNHQHTLDVKNRAFVPAKFKDGLVSGFMLTKGLDTCLFGYQYEEWQRFMRRLQDIPFTDSDGREFIRFFIGNAVDCEVDKQGRFNIPSNLREHAQLTKDLCFVGMMDHFEVWDSARWKEASGRYDCNADIQAEKMQKYLKASSSIDAV